MKMPRDLRTWRQLFCFFTIFSASAWCAQIPAGTILPAQLNSSLNSRKSKAGEKIRATVAQDVPLASGARIKKGSKLVGHIVSVNPAVAGTSARMTFHFDTLRTGKEEIHLTTALRAIAAMMDVFEAQLPVLGADRGTPEDAWVTEQIGGETDYHGGWPVIHGPDVVGHSLLGGGVLAKPGSQPGTPCRGEVGGNDQLQPFWVFASDACGTYGFSSLKISHAGRTEPVGEIVVTAKDDDINIRGGSGLLLRVISAGK